MIRKSQKRHSMYYMDNGNIPYRYMREKLFLVSIGQDKANCLFRNQGWANIYQTLNNNDIFPKTLFKKFLC